MQTCYTYDESTKRLTPAPKYATIDGAAVINPTREQCADSKCHCKDFRNKKAIGEPCICGIYVKMAKDAKKKGAK